jgi:hypothetical protein
MTHIVPERVVGVPAQPVAPIANVKFEIRDFGVAFYETAEAFNNVDVFETFDLARSAAVQAFSDYKATVLAAIARTEKELLTAQGPQILANPVAPTAAGVSHRVVPSAVAPNAPVVSTAPIA